MAIQPQNWPKVKALFYEALELSPRARSTFLRDKCADASVRAEVERLLAEHDEAETFLATPVPGDIAPEAESTVVTQKLCGGELLAGRFCIIRFLAGGGMGEVYEAEDQELRERVAIKIIRPEALVQPNAVARFKREVHLAKKVTHPNVCRIFDLFRHKAATGKEPEETVFISMELLHGKTLEEELKTRGRLSTEVALPLIEQMASALAAAHAVGVVHRDFKPGNVVLEGGPGQWRAVVTDFGLALRPLMSEETTAFSTGQGAVMGTPAYMSPEQLEGRPVTAATDIYALGLVMYEMVTGARLFRGDTPISAALKRLTEAPTPPRRFRPELSEAWETVILRCLERDPAQRLAKAEEVAKLLKGDEASPVSGIDWKVLVRQSKRPIMAIPVVLSLLLLGSLLGWWLHRSSRIQWARELALPQIEQLIKNEKLGQAYALAVQAERYIPHDPMLGKVWSDISWTDSIHTIPSGASVYRRDYNAPAAKWEFVGRTPIEKQRFPSVDSLWKFELKGYKTVERATFPDFAPFTAVIHLDEERSIPAGMVRVDLTTIDGKPPEVSLYGLIGFDAAPALPLGNFWIDKYEVTNAEFKRFVDGGGYQKQQYWKHEFRNDGHLLSWADAMKLFQDSTGRPGPAMWVQGNYPHGQDNYPVTGVSWFEAAAYAEFMGKALPTIYHWRVAARPMTGPSMIPASNFGGQGPTAVGTYQGISNFGAYDMAGNVKEWVLNEDGSGKHYILGGAWNEPSYTFYDADARSPFQRSANFGFRCAKYLSSDDFAKAANPVTAQIRDYNSEKPISDQLFNVYKSLYSYDKTPLNAVVESIKQTDNWKLEKITFDAAYGNERVVAYLFLPSKAKPPYQAVLNFPAAGALYSQSVVDWLDSFDIEFIVTSGRAVMLPIYKGTFERGGGPESYVFPRASTGYRDRVIMWSKDLGRSIDYLETRPDIVPDKLAYEGYSLGAALGAILPAIEDRLKALVLICPGFWQQKRLPEADQLNFAPRVKAPVLMLGGRFDYVFPIRTSQEPMFRLLGTPKEHKRWVVYDTGHDIPENEMIKETLNWLDRYLGPVK
jgi:eukaryotic-like serine/threonine-protein kinase